MSISDDQRQLADDDWDSLLWQIGLGKVIPVVGPGLVTVTSPENGLQIPLNQKLAPELAAGLQLSSPERFHCYNDVAREFLFKGGERRKLHSKLGAILMRLDVAPAPALLDLAGITDFRLFFAATPDHQLAKAVGQTRPGFSEERGIIRFHPNLATPPTTPGTNIARMPSPCDLPQVISNPLVYHILGDFMTDDFAVWEEDYMEYVCGLIETRSTLNCLFHHIKNSDLLLLGAPSEDWIVRFFLRAARGVRLSDRTERDYLADNCTHLGEPMIFFFNTAVRATRIIDGSPAAFVEELARRWHASHGTTASGDGESFLRRQPPEMPRGSVFISYSRDDLAVAVQVGQALANAGIPVWLDKQRLQPGENYERSLEYAIKDAVSFFISLISKATESDAARYVHRERAWAAQKHTDGYVFYIPLVIDETSDKSIRLEPECFETIHRERLDPGRLPDFVRKIHDYVEEFKVYGRPRG